MADTISLTVNDFVAATYEGEQLSADSNPAPLVAVIDLDAMMIGQLSELSYDLARRGAEAYNAMWLVLAHIAETGKWKADVEFGEGWEKWLGDWLQEVCNRTGQQQPYSIREAQTRLSTYRRLTSVGVDPVVAISGSSDVMAELTRAIGKWNNDGKLVQVYDEAKEQLATMYPDDDLDEQIRKHAETVAAIPKHKDAIALIEDTLRRPSDRFTYKFEVITAQYGTQIFLTVTEWDVTTGVALSETPYPPGSSWPDGAVTYMRALLNRQKKVKDV